MSDSQQQGQGNNETSSGRAGRDDPGSGQPGQQANPGGSNPSGGGQQSQSGGAAQQGSSQGSPRQSPSARSDQQGTGLDEEDITQSPRGGSGTSNGGNAQQPR